MDCERALITKIVTTGQLEEVIARGINADHFRDDECQDMFIYLTDHARKYKSPPSLSAVKTDRPKFSFEHVQDALDYLIDKFVGLVKRREAQDMVEELARACNDPKRSENIDLEFLEASRKLATVVPSSTVARFSDMKQRIEEYERRKAEGESFGVPFGFPTLDKYTSGIQPHEFVTIAGFSGLGKSTMLMALAFNAWSQGKTPLYISLEMEAGAILRKFDAMAASLDYVKLKQLDLPPEDIANWRKKAQEIVDTTHDIPVIDNIRHCTPDHIFAETVRHMPDLVVIDYLSLMRSGRPNARNAAMWQTVTEITQDIKQNARTLGIPVLAAAQTNRQGGKDGAELDNIGSSISIVQDSDVVIGLHADEEMRERKEMEVRLRKNRDGKLGKFRAVWDHENMLFREKELGEDYLRRSYNA